MEIKRRKKRPSVNVGDVFRTSHGDCKIIEYNGWDSVIVQFNDGYTKKVQVAQLRSGQIRNPYYPSVEGVGYLGEGSHNASDENGSTKVYSIWNSMLRRCYVQKQQERQPSYIGVEVCEHWHNFQNFAAWFESNKIDGWVLDKDLLSNEKKLYSPETCCFIPEEINSFLTTRKAKRGKYPIGVSKNKNHYRCTVIDANGERIHSSFKTAEDAFYFYKTHKEVKAKVLAEKYSDRLHVLAYNALMNYEVKITD